MAKEKESNVSRKKNATRVLMAVGAVAAVFTVIMCTLITGTYIQLRAKDPLNNAQLVELRERYAQGETSAEMKTAIRDLDLLARGAFFTAQERIRAGGYMALAAAVIAIAAFGSAIALNPSPPAPEGDTCPGVGWAATAKARAWVSGFAVILVAGAAMSVIVSPSALTSDLLETDPRDGAEKQPESEIASAADDFQVISEAPVEAPVEEQEDFVVVSVPEPAEPARSEPPKPEKTGEQVVAAAGTPADNPREGASPSKDELASNWPVFRGAFGSGLTTAKNLPVSWSEEEGKNILWKTDIELPGWSAPVVWNGSVVVTSADQEHRRVHCYDANSGAAKWTTDIPLAPGATEPYEPDTMDPRWDLIVFAGATPATNGKEVFALFSNGQLVALDLETGEFVWSKVLGQTDYNTYGLDNSILIYKDSAIVVFEGNEKFVARYEAGTGREIWKAERKNSTWASPILAPADGKELVVLLEDPNAVAWNAETGEEAWNFDVLPGRPDYCVGPSPTYVGGVVVVNSQNSGIFGINPANGSLLWSVTELPSGCGFPDGASMVTDGKYVYQYFDYFLACLDPRTGEVIKEKEMDDMAGYGSPICGENKLYLPGVAETIVLKANPEEDFPLLGKGVIKDTGDPTFAATDGKIFIRCDNSLYCISGNTAE